MSRDSHLSKFLASSFFYRPRPFSMDYQVNFDYVSDDTSNDSMPELEAPNPYICENCTPDLKCSVCQERKMAQ